MSMQLTTDVADPGISTSVTPGTAPFPSPHLLGMIHAGAADADARASLDVDIFERMRCEGLFHILVPPEFGGA